MKTSLSIYIALCLVVPSRALQNLINPSIPYSYTNYNLGYFPLQFQRNSNHERQIPFEQQFSENFPYANAKPSVEEADMITERKVSKRFLARNLRLCPMNVPAVPLKKNDKKEKVICKVFKKLNARPPPAPG